MLKKVFNISIISSLLLFLFGLVLAVNAEGFIKSITVAIGVVLLLIGVFPVIDYFRYRKEGLGASVGLISGIFSIVCGLMLLINEDLLMILIPVFIGVWMIINGINKIQVSFEIKDLGEEKPNVITFDITNYTEEQKEKLRCAIKYFSGDRNNMNVQVKIGEDIKPCGAIYYNDEVKKIFDRI